jgi:hypothetical protein
MSLEGVLRSPMGQPAMYEYRFADSAAAEYGKVDKPSFLWYGGMYFAALYRLLGVQDNSWNLSIGDADSAFTVAQWGLAFDGDHSVTVHREGRYLRSFRAGGADVHSCVVPLDIGKTADLNLTFGEPGEPYLRRANAIVHSVEYRGRVLTITLSSFDGHPVTVEVAGASGPKEALLDGGRVEAAARGEGGPGKVVTISFTGTDEKQTLSLTF